MTKPLCRVQRHKASETLWTHAKIHAYTKRLPVDPETGAEDSGFNEI